MARRRAGFNFVASFGVLVLGVATAEAQCGYPPDPWSTFAEYQRVCARYGGHISNRRCVDWNTNWCRQAPATPDGTPSTSVEDPAVEQRRLQERMLIQRQTEERERVRQQEQFIRDRDDAARGLKGGNASTGEVRGGGNTAFFGLKGTAPESAKTQINGNAPDRSTRDVSHASQQISCAAELTAIALKKVRAMESGAAGPRELDEIRYLVKEASNALHGDPVGVQCSPAAPIRFTKTPDPHQLVPLYDSMLNRAVRSAEALSSVGTELGPAKQKLEQAKARLAEVRRPSQAAPPKGALPPPAPKPPIDDAIAKAAGEQQAYHAKEQERIKQVYQEQEQRQKEERDALALLREAQRAYNAVNSQKYNADAALNDIAKRNAEILGGKLPSPN